MPAQSDLILLHKWANDWFIVDIAVHSLSYCSAEQARLVSILAENFGTFFIGLKYIDATNTFEWASGEYLSYTEAWDHSQPGKMILKNCYK